MRLARRCTWAEIIETFTAMIILKWHYHLIAHAKQDKKASVQDISIIIVQKQQSLQNSMCDGTWHLKHLPRTRKHTHTHWNSQITHIASPHLKRLTSALLFGCSWSLMSSSIWFDSQSSCSVTIPPQVNINHLSDITESQITLSVFAFCMNMKALC